MNSRPNVPNRIKTISKNVQTAIYIFAAYNFYNNRNCTSSTKYPFPARYSTVPVFWVTGSPSDSLIEPSKLLLMRSRNRKIIEIKLFSKKFLTSF